MRSIRNLLIALFFTSTFTIYIQLRFGGGKNVLEENYQSRPGGRKTTEERKGSGNEAVIVAYSLGKKLEMEGRYENCSANENVIEEEDEKEKRMWRKLPGNDVFVYSSHLDERLGKEGPDYIRILALIKTGTRSNNTSATTFYCNLVTKETTQRIKSTPSSTEEIWSDNWVDDEDANHYKPFLISCQKPNGSTQTKLYLSKRKCSTNALKIDTLKRQRVKKDDFRICVKPLDFKEDISLRLIKWIEMNFILGVNKIIFYIYSVHRKVYKVLNYYKKLGRIDFIKTKPPFPFLKEQNIWQKRKLEILYYNDCFYQNLHKTKYIIPLDIDELIIPKQCYKLQNIVFQRNYSSYNVRNTYYFSTNYFDYYKSEYSAEGESGKSFINTDNALTIFNHYALKTLRPGTQNVNFLSTDVVQMNHYKTTCDINLLPECSKYNTKIYDDIMKKYKNDLEKKLNLHNNNNKS